MENQRCADKRLPHLADTDASICFLSCDPLLGKVDLAHWLESGAVHWVIAGGESGPRARPSDPQWFQDIRTQCLTHDTPFHFKQWGDWAPLDAVPGLVPKTVANGGAYSTAMGRFGKKASGRLLDGESWDELPVT